MNFFEHQHKARRKTWLLSAYFILAVVMIVIAVNLAVYVALFFSIGDAASRITDLEGWLAGPYAIWISLATLGVILIGTLSTMARLRGGGRVVANIVGAQKIDSNTMDLNERRLINIVEEMSIASGMPVPELYVMEDNAINAFVAGFRPTETVLVVTRGALEHFSRDELQGVIGHEYSHIFNGDMRINVRLMGVLAGILVIGQIGRFLLRSSGRGRTRSKGQGHAVFLGLLLFVIGYIGLFFGSLIKAAISRQREFLADASSVQFTRNPDGIAGALWTIKENQSGSRLANAHAEDISHFCFSDAIGSKFISLMATHPPLDERIKAINPHFDLKKRLQRRSQQQSAEPAMQAGIPGVAMGFAGAATGKTSGPGISASIGQTQVRHLSYAEKIHAAIPQQLKTAVHDPATVQALVFALILTEMRPEDRPQGKKVIEQAGKPGRQELVDNYFAQLKGAVAQYRMALVNIAIPVLKSLGWEDRARFLTVLEDLIKSDQRYTIFEFALMTILREHLAENSGRDVREKYFKYADVMPEINLLLSMLARTGSGVEAAASVTHGAIMKHFTPGPVRMASQSDCKLSAISSALEKLNLLSPILKQSILESFADCVIHDGKILPAEAELLEAIAISLDCPIPPLLA